MELHVIIVGFDPLHFVDRDQLLAVIVRDPQSPEEGLPQFRHRHARIINDGLAMQALGPVIAKERASTGDQRPRFQLIFKGAPIRMQGNTFCRSLMLAASALLTATSAHSASTTKSGCEQCASWNAPQKPLQIYGNTYYVGVHGLSSILITSDKGHVLIDGALAESVPQIKTNIQALGFRVQDIKLILNSHVHSDHAGGIAALQSSSGATVAALVLSAKVLEQGFSDPDDPQYGILLPIDKVRSVRVIKDGEILRVGELTLTAHATPGHTPGGTSWTWKSCEQSRCLDMVYVDSVSPVSADGFKYSQSKDYPNAVADFEKSFATIAALPCDILMTPHPDVSDFLTRIDKRGAGPNALVDNTACKRFAAASKQRFAKRLAEEAAQ